MGDVRRISEHDDRPSERTVFLNGPSFLSGLVEWLFARGHAADLVLVVMLVELAGLTVMRGWPFRTALFRLLPGALMIAALRAALTGADWRWIALALALSFPAHLVDLSTRPRRGV